MIVNYTKKGWQIITQRAHGLIAAEICSHWQLHASFEGRWLETIIAVAEHDDAYNEFDDDDVLNDQGGPMNFNMRPFKKNFCDTLISMALSKSKYIALLITHHIQFLYSGKSGAATNYCKALKKWQLEWRKDLKLSKEDVESRYRLLQWCDALSLIICQNHQPPEQRKLDISIGPNGKLYKLIQVENGVLSVYPWPFAKPQFSLLIESRFIETLYFNNVSSFHKQLRAAAVQNTRITFSNKYGASDPVT
ncbi:DUF3891 family protein [Olivibacter sp. SDN3]|uniref:DUF3891 family protein n=1 Tax=Olivibacter sp. SDN3 TaxID=2764720 RepID=UPI00165177B2|nr:DUF3891 family protein [Olivibacter sp. SDN3]QNL49064.1 DUF3891 family protein [Olivibacter sp. SDN3]